MVSLLHVLAAIVLTALTQVGGVAWLLALVARGTGGFRLIRFTGAFVVLYLGFSAVAASLAPGFGRVALPCGEGGVQPVVLCAMNRHYADPALRDMAVSLVRDVPGTRLLDAGFPLPGMPLLPHLSHHDGRKLDIALPFEGGAAFTGYWQFADPRPGEPQPCKGQAGPLRWDMDWLQPALPDGRLDEDAARALLDWLARSGPAHGVEKVLVEPHLPHRLRVDSPLFRFQGCAAARHDDHIHVALGG